jgi:hypothetical protein
VTFNFLVDSRFIRKTWLTAAISPYFIVGEREHRTSYRPTGGDKYLAAAECGPKSHFRVFSAFRRSKQLYPARSASMGYLFIGAHCDSLRSWPSNAPASLPLIDGWLKISLIRGSHPGGGFGIEISL